MPNLIEGQLTASGIKVGVVLARFNSFITEALLSGALDCLQRHGVKDPDITIVKVPGSFELPLACRKLAQTGGVDAVIALGAIIRGATTHYDLVCSEAAKGVAQAGMETGVPVIFGVITTDTIEQAIERAGTKAGNKGADAALAAIEMVNVMRELSE
ncbi:MAG: 6,7-dimethyl-8-ribityllumazine synthase [Proteobacteria bacterium]|nr:MAG: 6,7-dimethyl-8-ribityllumazine synthase [Pseudomonadota bacterium]